MKPLKPLHTLFQVGAQPCLITNKPLEKSLKTLKKKKEKEKKKKKKEASLEVKTKGGEQGKGEKE